MESRDITSHLRNDIVFIKEIKKTLENGDNDFAMQMLDDWRYELSKRIKEDIFNEKQTL